ncbi:MAG: galactokinase [Candidatus Latescibacteria bacterium]|nr:galactokinase [Candidatus Latescibacterota bacterium]
MFGVSAREDNVVRVCDAVSEDTIESCLDPDVQPEVGHWSNYPETVFRRVARNFVGDLRGADIVFASDLPPAAGMSSSSALMVGFFLVIDAINGLQDRVEYQQNILTDEDLAGYLGTLENGQTFGSLVGDKGVGTFGGSEDHTAIMNCKANNLSQYAYCPVNFERIMPVPDSHTLVIGVSGIIAEKTGDAMAKYNRASGLAFAALHVWNQTSKRGDPHLAAAVRSAGAEEIRNVLSISQSTDFSAEDLTRRFDHFALENEEILPQAGDALSAGDVVGFGRWANESQLRGVELLQNQIPETEALAKLAVSLGAAGASAFGAGFGGSVWALVARDSVDAFLGEWKRGYLENFPQHQRLSQFFSTEASVGAFEVVA